ncbi:DUF1996 domain-containing protein [Streptomyces peucetius]|uniref:DUF1996 domain-containing protein n=1 Tax=Streptomyces peucetius TaxID=1950 RepID=A0ABY6II89_STRPE|nr:DUF1996 domain-containing protein [Streptomyces peucetius]UYQ66732.1 DUF1996 domain-containing protein [Streptomyces peucetius]
MARATRRRPRAGARTVAASIALILGGGGLIAVNSYAAAGEGHGPWPGGETRQEQRETLGAGPSPVTVKCPEAANGLPEVPEAARAEVDRELATMDNGITEAYQRFADEQEQIARDPRFAQNAILGPLRNKREAGLDRIAEAIGRITGQRPQGLRALAPCTLQTDGGDGAGQDGGADGGDAGGDGGGVEAGNGGQAGNGPEPSDFADIRTVAPNVQNPPRLRGASRGTFTTDCGVNANGKFNPDNVIVAPGVSNGAHHMHDYVGNQANDAFASDEDLAAGATTCRDEGDRSTYYWPVLRLQNGQDEDDAQADGGGKDRNVGEILTPSQVTLDFVGNPRGKVTAMPRFLRIITGDAKAFVNGDANANASWSCTGFEDRQLEDKYPVCPQGSKVVRSFRFQSCWDGRNTDSANHRTHVAFTDASGRCPGGFVAIPQLVQRIVYDVPPPVFEGADAAVFALDSFPEQLHKPVTDHGDFINVFDEKLMRELVSCLNEGRRCGPGDASQTPGGRTQEPKDAPGTATGTPTAPAEQETDAPARPTAPAADPEPAPAAPREPATPTAAPPNADRPAAERSTAEHPAEKQETEAEQAPRAPEAAQARPEAAKVPAAPAAPAAGASPGPSEPATAADARRPAAPAGTDTTAQAPPTPTTTADEPPGVPVPDGGDAPQAVGGGALAETGAQLWPSAAGAVLLVAGVALLRVRTRRGVTRRR